MTFTFAGVNLAGKSLVAFETMEFGGAEYMVHADIDDVEQAVAIVDIATNARDAETGTNVGTIGERELDADCLHRTRARRTPQAVHVLVDRLETAYRR